MANSIEKVILGKSKLSVSKLCYGTLSLGPYHSNFSPVEGAKLLVYAYQNGINFWDTAELYETYPHIVEALKILNYPKDMVISSRSYSRNYTDMMISIDNTLKYLNVETISIFGIHELADLDDFNESEGAFEALLEAKEKGKIQNIKVSTHSVKALKLINSLEFIDVVFPLYNYKGIGILDGTLDDMSFAIEASNSLHKGIYAMKVLGGGHLIKETQKALDFVVNNKHIHSIAIGMSSEDEINMNIALINQDIENIDYIEEKILKQKRYLSIDPWCVGCGECIKNCPNSALSIEFSQAKVHNDKCILCGYCASYCKYFCIKVVKERE